MKEGFTCTGFTVLKLKGWWNKKVGRRGGIEAWAIFQDMTFFLTSPFGGQ